MRKGDEIRTLGGEKVGREKRGWYLDILMVALITRRDARGGDGRDKDDDAPDALPHLENATLRAADNGTRSHSLFTYTPVRQRRRRRRKVRNPPATPPLYVGARLLAVSIGDGSRRRDIFPESGIFCRIARYIFARRCCPATLIRYRYLPSLR